MSPQDTAHLEPIEGVVIPGSRLTALVGLAVAPVATALAAVGLVLWWTTKVGAPGNAIVACAAGVVIGLVITVWALRELVSPMWLILGQNTLQVVRGKRQVLVQIPYSNIINVVYEKQDSSRSIRIDLAAVDEPNTYLPKMPPGCQVFMLTLTASNLPVYSGKPKTIFEALDLRINEFRASST
jgi:hypothetical protein